MRERADLVAEAQVLVDQYRICANTLPNPPELQHVGIALGRALEALEHQDGEAMTRAQVELAHARSTLAAVRRAMR
jgi:hypothetical protein